MAREKWFRLLATCPCCGLRSNVDRLANGRGTLPVELTGHSVVNGEKGRFVNLMLPVTSPDVTLQVREQIMLKLVDLVVDAAEEFSWLAPHIVERLGGDAFRGMDVDLPDLDHEVEGPALEYEVGGPQWQKVVQMAGELPVAPPSAPDVERASKLAGRSARTAPARSPVSVPVLEMPVEGVQETAERLLAEMEHKVGTGTRKGGGASGVRASW